MPSVIGERQFIDKTEADGIFSPDIWSKKVLRATENNLVLAGLYNRSYESDAKVGKSVKIPTISNLSARPKPANDPAVSFDLDPSTGATNTGEPAGAAVPIKYETPTETVTTITLDKWVYSAVGIEDFVEVQAQVPIRSEYEDKIGYALAQYVDTELAGSSQTFLNVVGVLGTPITDEDVRRAVQYLDDANVPEEGRFMVLSPAEKNDKLGLDRWSNQLYRGGNGGQQVTRGQIGSEVYGLKPYVTTNLVKPSAGQAYMVIAHKDAYALIMQRSPKMHLFYDIDFFTWKIASEEIYGYGELRDPFGVQVRGKG